MKLFLLFSFFIYRYVLSPLGVVFLLLLSPFHKKIAAGLKMRAAAHKRPHLTDPIWIHAASGEFEYAKSVIRMIKEKAPATQILVTYFSPSYKAQIENFPGIDHSEPLPLDLPGPVRSFLKHYKPKCLLIARTDLWPEVMHTCGNRQIPVLLFATTFRPLVGIRKLFKPFYSFLFQNTSDVFCVSQLDVENLKPVVASANAGDPRYDQVLHRLQQPKKLPIDFLPADSLSEVISRPIFIAGSTWPEDEEILFPALKMWIQQKKMRLIIAPHEPSQNHMDSILKELKNWNISVQKWTECNQFTSDCLILDKVGVLAECYALADIAFVGGSFRKKVHSVMEPLGAGKPVVVGPFFENNREATEFSKLHTPRGHAPVKVIHSAEELSASLDEYLKNKENLNDLRCYIESEFTKRLGATQKVFDWATPYLNFTTKEADHEISTPS